MESGLESLMRVSTRRGTSFSLELPKVNGSVFWCFLSENSGCSSEWTTVVSVTLGDGSCEDVEAYSDDFFVWKSSRNPRSAPLLLL